jgi:hypothetical protein
MKFISKSTNLLIVLRPGLSAQPITGTPAKPTISVRFKDGIADVQSEELVQMMLSHPGFNSDFISADNIPVDPYAATRQSSEPAHTMTELKFGTPINKKTEGGNMQLPPELQKLVTQMAAEMAKKMLPSMVESTLKNIVSSHEKEAKTVKKGSTGPGIPCQVEGCNFVGRNANGLRLHAKKHQGKETNVLSKSTENPATQESVS